MIKISNQYDNITDPQKAQSLGEEMGEAIARGIGVGLDKGSMDAITSAKNVYVELESYTKNAAKNAENLQKKRRQRELDNLKNSRDLELITEQEYYQELKNYRDRHLRQGTDAWFKATEEIAKYNKKLLDETAKAEEEYQKQMEKLREDFGNRAKKTAEATIDLHNELREKLSQKLTPDSPLATEQKITIRGGSDKGRDIVYTKRRLADIDQQIDEIQSYRDLINSLKELGNIPQSLFEELGKMSVGDATVTAKALLEATPQELEKFLSGYTMRGEIADSVAEAFYPLFNTDQIRLMAEKCGEAFAEGYGAGDEFTKILEEAFENVPPEYYLLGESAGEAFGEGFSAGISGLQKGINPYTSGVSGTTISGGDSNVFNTSYIFNSSKDTTTQQLSAARNAATLQRLRGGI